MNLSDLSNFKTGSKFILTKDFTPGTKFYMRNSNWNEVKTLPRGLVLSVVSVKFNAQTQKIIFKVIRAKNVIKEVYEPAGVDPKFYTTFNYRDELTEFEHVNIHISGISLAVFLDGIDADSFNARYNQLTAYVK